MASQLIKKAISGDTEALSLLVDQYKELAYNLALSIVKNKEDAKDITQDSLLKVLENIQQFRNASKFSTWLYRIVYNQSIAFVKKEKRSHTIDESLLIEASEISETQAEMQEKKIQDLHKAIQLLEDTDRHIIILFYLAEKSIKEISHITGFSIANIKVILHRSRKKLYRTLDHEKQR